MQVSNNKKLQSNLIAKRKKYYQKKIKLITKDSEKKIKNKILTKILAKTHIECSQFLSKNKQFRKTWSQLDLL